MISSRRIITLDANVFVAALKADEPYRGKCREMLNKVADAFILAEPSIIYQEVCGTLARKVGKDIARVAEKQLDRIINPKLLVDCDREFCTAAYPFCSEFNIYAIDALYLKVALDARAPLVSLDKKGFIDKVRRRGMEAYHVSEFP